MLHSLSFALGQFSYKTLAVEYAVFQKDIIIIIKILFVCKILI